MEKHKTLEALVDAGMPQHQLDAIRNGGAAPFQGHTYTAEGLGVSAAGGLESAVVTAQQVSSLKAQLEAAQARIAELEAEDKPERKKPGPKPKTDDKDDKPEGE